MLGAIPYQENEAVLHTDTRLLPRRKLAWAAWNYHVLPQARERVALTYNMNILQGLDAPTPFCVTLNHSDAIDPAKIIKRITLPPSAVHARRRGGAGAPARRSTAPLNTYYCGAYWRYGFHEDGVVSALNALEHFREHNQHAQRALHRTG